MTSNDDEISQLTHNWKENGFGFDKSFKHPIDSTDPESFLLDNIPITIHVQYHKFMAMHADTIVSIGSGCGTVDNIFKSFWNDFFLVDPHLPHETIYCRKDDNKVILESDFACVTDLITSKPDIVGECGVFIMYPYPSKDAYDLAAIKALNPKVVLISYEYTGSSGSEQLLEWLINQTDYVHVAEYESLDFYIRFRRHYRGLYPCVSLLLRKDVQQLTESPPSGAYYTEDDYDRAKKVEGPKLAYFGHRKDALKKSNGEEILIW
jgi:hypothetical protein